MECPLKGLIKYGFFFFVGLHIDPDWMSRHLQEILRGKSIHGAQKTTPHDSDTPDLYWNISTAIVRNAVHGTIDPPEWVLWAFIFFLHLKVFTNPPYHFCETWPYLTGELAHKLTYRLWYPFLFSYLLTLHCMSVNTSIQYYSRLLWSDSLALPCQHLKFPCAALNVFVFWEWDHFPLASTDSHPPYHFVYA